MKKFSNPFLHKLTDLFTKEPSEVPDISFAKFLDLGIVQVPDHYDTTTVLASSRNHYGNLFHHSDLISNAQFSNPSRTLEAGDRLRICVHRPIVSGFVTFDEQMAYLKTLSGIQFVGAQGASLVLRYMRTRLPKGKWYVSFDKKESLPLVGDVYGVPGVRVSPFGIFEFGLTHVNPSGVFQPDICGPLGIVRDWWEDYYLLSFHDEPQKS